MGKTDTLQSRSGEIEITDRTVGSNLCREQRKGMEQKKNEVQENDMEDLVLQNNALLMEIKDFHEELSDFKIREISLEKKIKNEKQTTNEVRKKLAECDARLAAVEKKSKTQQQHLTDQIDRLKNQTNHRISGIKMSSSFRIGQAFVNAVVKPGKNTIMLPFRFINILFYALSGKERELDKRPKINE